MNIKINAEKREIGKKSHLTELRKNGYIPGIIYGNGEEGIKISLNAQNYKREYKKTIGEVAFFDITVDGKTYKTFIKDKQVHPLSREIVHIDFLELHKGKPITIEVPINYEGDAIGAKEGGQLEVVHRTIQITCLPKDIPEEIKVDISELGVGDAIHWGDLEISKEIDSNFTEDTTLAAVNIPSVMEEPEPVEEEVEGEETAEGAEEGTSEEAGEEDSKPESE